MPTPVAVVSNWGEGVRPGGAAWRTWKVHRRYQWLRDGYWCRIRAGLRPVVMGESAFLQVRSTASACARRCACWQLVGGSGIAARSHCHLGRTRNAARCVELGLNRAVPDTRCCRAGVGRAHHQAALIAVRRRSAVARGAVEAMRSDVVVAKARTDNPACRGTACQQKRPARFTGR
jgi:hypothetical protein